MKVAEGESAKMSSDRMRACSLMSSRPKKERSELDHRQMRGQFRVISPFPALSGVVG